MGRFFQCCTGPLVVPSPVPHLNLPSHNLRTFFPEISGSTEEHVAVVFKLSFKYLRLLRDDTLAQSQCSQPVLLGHTKRWQVYPLCVQISRIRQSGSSAVRCLVWTCTPPYPLGRRREQVEKTTAMSGGSPMSCAGAL